MGYGYEDCLEVVAMDKLNCSLDDLQILPKVYSDLAEECEADFRVLGSMHDLQIMTEYSFKCIKDYIVDCLRTTANSNAYIKVVPDDVYDYVKYSITDFVKWDILKVARRLEEIQPYIVKEDLQNAKFNSLIDEAIDIVNDNFETFGEEVADVVIQLAYDKGLIRVSEVYKEDTL